MNSLLLLLAATLASATPVLDARQETAIAGALTPVSSALTNLDNAVRAINASDSRTVTVILQAGAAAQSSMDSAAVNVRTTNAMRALESRLLSSVTGDVNNQMAAMLQDFVAQKAVLDQFGAGPTVVNMLQNQKFSNSALQDAILSKFPDTPRNSRDSARADMQRVNQAFDDTVAALKAPAVAAPPPAAQTNSLDGVPPFTAPQPAAAQPTPNAPAPAPPTAGQPTPAPAPAAPAPAPAAPAPAEPAPAAPAPAAPAPAEPAPAAPAPAAPAPAAPSA